MDALRIVSIDPSAGEVVSASSGGTLTRENSIEVVLEYDLVSAPDAVVSAELRAPGAGRITSIEASPNRVYDDRGRVRKRLGVSCGPDTRDRIRDLRIHYRMFVPAGRTLVDEERPLTHTIRCLADDLRLVSVDPPSGEIASASSGETLTRENSIEVVLEYDLVSAPEAVVSAELRAPRVGWITSLEASPNRIYDDHGRVRKRLAIACPDTLLAIRELRIRYWMFVTGPSTLAEREQSLPHTIRCAVTVPRAAARLPDQAPPPRFEARPPVARPAVREQPRPETPPAAARPEVARPPGPAIDPGVAKRPPPAGIDPGMAERLGACTDPAAAELYPRLVGRTDPSRGVGIVEIVGVVRNVGRAAYLSEPRQQSADLIEESPGMPPRAVATRTFTNLAPNGTVRLVHRRGWDTGTEFQPRYRLRLTYEPDIRTDANPRNDDCGLGNNESVLEPERINALFR